MSADMPPIDRDALSEDALIELDLQDVKRGPGVSEDAARRLVRERVRRERAEAADGRLADELGTTVTAIRQARAERIAEEARARTDRQMAAARSAVGASDTARSRGGPPRGAEITVTVHRIIQEARFLASEATQPAVAERLGCSDRRIRQVLHEAKPPLTWRDVLRLAAG